MRRRSSGGEVVMERELDEHLRGGDMGQHVAHGSADGAGVLARLGEGPSSTTDARGRRRRGDQREDTGSQLRPVLETRLCDSSLIDT